MTAFIRYWVKFYPIIVHHPNFLDKFTARDKPLMALGKVIQNDSFISGVKQAFDHVCADVSRSPYHQHRNIRFRLLILLFIPNSAIGRLVHFHPATPNPAYLDEMWKRWVIMLVLPPSPQPSPIKGEGVCCHPINSIRETLTPFGLSLSKPIHPSTGSAR